MNDNLSSVEFFLGANTPLGFFSLFDQLYNPDKNWFCHILKGGPGTGKSTLMKKIVEKSRKKNITHEIIRCPSDPKSLDAVILCELKRCFVDGTAPHVMEPKYPGISDEIINLGEHWNTKLLQKSKQQIIDLCNENSGLHGLSKRYLTAYSYAHNSNLHIVNECIDYEKLKAFCNKFSEHTITKSNSKSNEQKSRFISSITPDGYILLEKTIKALCKKLFVIEDSYGLIGNYILESLKNYALELNHSIITCPSPFSPSEHIEAIFITDIGIGFIVKNQFLDSKIFKNADYEIKKISIRQFLEKKKMSENKNIISFNNKICKEFIRESIKNLSEARNIHDKIEHIYASSMNYNKVNKIAQKLIESI